MKMISFLICFILFASSASAGVVKHNYLQQWQQCEQDQIDFLSRNENQTNAAMKQSSYDRVDCYKTIAFSIIDKHYSANASAMKQNFTTFIQASYAFTGDAYMSHNDCPEYCGTMMHVIYANSAAEHVKEAVHDLISALSIIHPDD